VTAARAEYLFILAHTCHIPPPVVDELTLADFGQLCLGIDAMNDPDGG
jgi:hypothetical protein